MDVFSLVIICISFLSLVAAFSIMHLRRVKAEKEKWDEFEEINKAKSDFVSLASHQLRTPLSTIRWYTEMLIDEETGKVNKKQRKYLEEVYEANKRMIDLVNALLTISRLEMGTFIVEPEDCSVVEILNEIIREMSPIITKKKIQLMVETEGCPSNYKADPRLLKLILKNIISNALKYNKEKGKLDIQINPDKDFENLFIVISDTGLGIPKDQQEFIFQKLFRADNIKEQDTDGAGLGLYIVSLIIEYANGKIWFKSEENKGSTFFVSLPINGMKKKKGSKHIN